MVQYDHDTLQAINENADLLAYVSQTLELEKRGNDYFAHCPAHVDETPSLSFTPEKNSFYCFSCGRSGGIIGYLMKIEGLPFEKAVEKAAALAKVDLSKMCHSDTMIFLKKIRAMRMAKNEPYHHEILDMSIMSKYRKAPIEEWIKEGINQDVMDLFGVMYDDRSNRIVYPVYDSNDHLINIKGRTRYDNYKLLKLPKYINYFEVGCMDYLQGLNITRKYILEADEVIIFESVKSVMLAYGWGYKHAVSAEKHTLTDEQVDIIVKLKVDVVFAYDTDVNYDDSDVQRSIDKLKRITNVYLIKDKNKLLGGPASKNAPVDCGREVWEELYKTKRKVV